MADKVDKNLCDERSGNIQKCLGKIEKQLAQIWDKIDKMTNPPTYNVMSTKKIITLMTATSVVIYSIVELIKVLR